MYDSRTEEASLTDAQGPTRQDGAKEAPTHRTPRRTLSLGHTSRHCLRFTSSDSLNRRNRTVGEQRFTEKQQIGRYAGRVEDALINRSPCRAHFTSVTGEQRRKMSSDCDKFNFIVWGVIVTSLCCLGFVGNMLSLLAFQQERRVPATTLLQCLASSDLVLLLSVFITDCLPYVCDYTDRCANPWTTWPYIRYVWIATPISHMCSIWFVVLIALNRYWAVCRPHTIGTVWTNRRTAVYVACAVLLVVTFNTPRFFEYRIAAVHDEPTNGTRLVEQKTTFGLAASYKIAYKVLIVNILLVLLPIAVLVVITGFILRGLRCQSMRLTSARGRQDSDKAGKVKVQSSRRTSEITVMLVVVVMVNIFCQSPLAAFHFVRYTQSYRCADYVYYLDNISKLLVNVNSSINFIIYCVASRKFRAGLVQLITCAKEQPTPSTTYGRGSRDSRATGYAKTNGCQYEETDV